MVGAAAIRALTKALSFESSQRMDTLLGLRQEKLELLQALILPKATSPSL